MSQVSRCRIALFDSAITRGAGQQPGTPRVLRRSPAAEQIGPATGSKTQAMGAITSESSGITIQSMR